MQETINTPCGRIRTSDIDEVKQIAGLKLIDGEWAPVCFPCKGKKVNQSSERKANEKGLIDTEIYIPIRMYNFQYALSQCDFNVKEAIKYAKSNLFGLDGQPVFLPERLSVTDVNDKGKEVVLSYMSYTKILNAAKEKERKFVEENYEKININPKEYSC